MGVREQNEARGMQTGQRNHPILGTAAMQTDKTEKAGKSSKAGRYGIDIFMAWCKSCGICVAFCPRNCLDQDEESSPLVTRPELCIGCGWCEIHCPDFAISLRQLTDGKAHGEEEAE